LSGRRKTAVRLSVLVLCALVLLLVLAPAAFAHTELVHWEVVPGSAGTPPQLLLRFSEPIDSKFLTVALFDQQGRQLRSGGVTIDPKNPNDGYVDLTGISPGTYSVAWWTRALDGDTSNGSFFTGLGTTVNPVALLPPVGARDPATQPAMQLGGTVWDTILHWLTYVAAALLIGSVGFALIVWRPALRRSAAKESARDPGAAPALGLLDKQLLSSYRMTAISGAILFLFANLLLLVMQAGLIRYSLLQPVTSVAPTPLPPSTLSHAPAYPALGDILSGHNGRVWIARMILGAVALVLAFLMTPSPGRRMWRWVATLTAALGALFTVSLSAHAAVVSQSAYATFIDWSHMTMMSLWIGGMLALLVTLRAARRPKAADRLHDDTLVPTVVRRFSTLALVAVIYLASTGLFAAFLHVRSPSLLIPTTYGRALIAKLALFAVLIGFGALYRQVFIPRLRGELERGRSSLQQALPLEMTVGCCLLAAVALMASLGTSNAVWPAHQALGVVSVSKTAEMTAVFRAIPGKAGENAVALDLTDHRQGPASTPSSVTLQFAGKTIDLAPVTSQTGGTLRFAAPGLTTLPEGAYSVGFTVVRPGYPDYKGQVHLDIPPALKPKG
jgi:copper transport protein